MAAQAILAASTILFEHMPLKVPEHLAMIIRKQAVAALSLEKSKLLETMEPVDYHDENAELIVLGPVWPEAADRFIRRLKGLGLEYVDDFFEIGFDRPDWRQFFAQKNRHRKRWPINPQAGLQ